MLENIDMRLRRITSFRFADFMVKCKNELLAMGYQKFAMEDVSTRLVQAYTGSSFLSLLFLQFQEAVSGRMSTCPIGEYLNNCL